MLSVLVLSSTASFALVTGSRLISRMTSPGLRPARAEAELGATCVISAPLSLAGKFMSRRPVRSRSSTATPLSTPSSSLRFCFERESRPPLPMRLAPGFSEVVTANWVVLPARRTSRVSVVPGAKELTWFLRLFGSVTGWPLRAVITSPSLRPALAAGLSGMVAATSAPLLSFRLKASARAGVRVLRLTPR